MNIVGVNYSIDSAAALLQNGQRLAASAEERFTRIKHDRNFPTKALDFCLSKAGIGIDDIDHFAFFWNPGRHIEPMLGRLSGAFRHHAEFLFSYPNFVLQKMGQPGVAGVEQVLRLDDGRRVSFHFVDHHMAHAAAAFFNSPFDDAAILTVDGYGERNATLIGSASGQHIEAVHTIDFPHSIGALYAAVSQHLGFRPNSGEGKVMGLASYGDDSLVDKMRPLVKLTEEGFELDLSYFHFMMERTTRYSPKLVELMGPPRAPESELTHHHENIAYALQAITEDILLHVARMAKTRTGKKNLCIAGGVALNCVANRRIMLEAGFENIFILPPSGDGGSSLGAAQYVAHVLHNEPRDTSPYLDYLGFESSPEDIRYTVETSGAHWFEASRTPPIAARLISEGYIGGWYQGRTEFGPRALGNRSIIADPRPAKMKDILNARVKFREPFRPFAPSCLEESCGELFDSSVPSPYMLRVYNTLPERKKDIESITHVDGGARVQTVNPDQNPRYYALIKEFGKITGVDCILNTSFNIRGEPIVNTVREAMFCFLGTDMDFLCAGDFMVFKDPELKKKAEVLDS